MRLFNNFPYPDTHQLNLDWILDKLGGIQKALTDAQAAANTAKTSATSAQESASNAQTSMTQAQTFANTAQTSATSAQEGATSAQESASSAQTIVAELANIFVNNAGAHNAIYRGKSLGSTVTTAQYATIKDGTFNDLYIGAY